MIGSSRVRVDSGWQTVSSISGAESEEEEEAKAEEVEEVEEVEEEESSRRLARARGTSESDEGRR